MDRINTSWGSKLTTASCSGLIYEEDFASLEHAVIPKSDMQTIHACRLENLSFMK